MVLGRCWDVGMFGVLSLEGERGVGWRESEVLLGLCPEVGGRFCVLLGLCPEGEDFFCLRPRLE